MTKINDILDSELLAKMVADGYVRIQVHPDLPYSIYNYTDKAAHERVWNEATLTCRGLIVDNSTGSVLARPFRKFFNHSEASAPVLFLDARVTVTDKQDGSLGILYPTPSGWAVATRGSFASEQALHATEVLRSKYGGWGPAMAGWTVLVEIIYPANRIVVDYGDFDELVLLGVVNISTGRSYGPHLAKSWPGPVTQTFPYTNFAEALAAPPRPNAEGLVVHLVDLDERVKLKQEDYVALHRIVTGLTARTVWEHMVEGKPLSELIEPLPDEFHDWVHGVHNGILAGISAEEFRLTREFEAALVAMPSGWAADNRAGRKDFAMLAARHPDKWALFALLDGKPIRPELLKRAKPEPYLTPSGRTFSEDVA